MYSITRYHDISAGHRVVGHEGKCQHLHGHNYRIHFTVGLAPNVALDQVGRVIDFSVIKTRLCEWVERFWDHRFLVWQQDPLREKIYAADASGVIVVGFNPTAENMAQFLVEVIGPQMLKDTGTVLIEVTIEETRKCSATFTKP